MVVCCRCNKTGCCVNFACTKSIKLFELFTRCLGYCFNNIPPLLQYHNRCLRWLVYLPLHSLYLHPHIPLLFQLVGQPQALPHLYPSFLILPKLTLSLQPSFPISSKLTLSLLGAVKAPITLSTHSIQIRLKWYTRNPIISIYHLGMLMDLLLMNYQNCLKLRLLKSIALKAATVMPTLLVGQNPRIPFPALRDV